MWSFMESTKPVVFTDGNTEGIERVKKGNGKYAFLMESTTIEYVIERECDTTQIGGLLDSKGYGIALPPGMQMGFCLNTFIDLFFVHKLPIACVIAANFSNDQAFWPLLMNIS